MTDIEHAGADDLRTAQPRAASVTYLRSLGRSLGVKALSLPLTGLTAVIATRTVLDTLGVAGFALFALATTLPSLVPSDLGTLSAIVDAMARCRGGDFVPLRRAIVSTARLLIVAGVLSAVAGIVPACLGAWSLLLGRHPQPGTDAAVAAAFVLFGCNLPLSLGNTALVALNRTHLAYLLQMAGSVLTIGLILLAGITHATPAVFVAARFLGQCLVGVAGLFLAGRYVGVPLFCLVVGSVHRKQAGTYIRHLVGPTAVVNLSFAVSYSTDRLVLSHAVGDEAVAAYSAAANLITPAFALVSAAGLPLWALFAHQRGSADSSSVTVVARLTSCFAAGGLIMGAGLVLVGAAAGSWLTHDKADVSTGLMTAFAALLIVYAASQPVGIWLTDAAGLRFQAIRAGIMAAVNLVLSIPLAYLIGTPGPVIASVIALTVVVFLPNFRMSVSRAVRTV